ncbi:glycosyltransferase family 4 protein [Silvimonas sp.]|uniref:glycosyltransferase n=1 Tax=Silvimonas sp. TaxID=2650811 RepID=UPI002850CC44|nr:glycosyltransferase family 4 protein [Silvimonas sp.]MDR3427050.1 glycosyltransferase family 4 protein [Silvimonas sp.]
MRLTFICAQLPYPPNHGGTVDMWRRVCALHDAGVKLRIVCWHQAEAGDPELAENLARIREKAESVVVFPFQTGLASKLPRLARLLTLPWAASARSLSEQAYAAVLGSERAAAVDAVWLDGLYGGDLALKLAHALQRPLFYRSHNIEHRYTRYQLNSAHGMREQAHWLLRNCNVEHFERRVLREAEAFFDISVDDLAYWRACGFTHGHWLPTLVDQEMAARLSAPVSRAPEFDVGYLGNLFMPNNVFGISWFIEQVVPTLLQRNPALRIFIAGSRPNERIRALLTAVPQITLIESPPDAAMVLRNAKVLINPVFAGSGVNVKSVEMLFTPAALVSTPQGLAGLPENVAACFQVATEADAFAQAIQNALQADLHTPAYALQRQRARQCFQSSRIAEILPVLQNSRAHEIAAPTRTVAVRGIDQKVG